ASCVGFLFSFFFSSRRRHTRFSRDWSSDVCSSDLPHDATGVKALAIAARACFENFRPGGMRVHAGAVVLEPTLRPDDFAELQRAGVHLAKFGFGRYDDPADGADQVRWAQQHGITVMC